jgi:hypothetical protein
VYRGAILFGLAVGIFNLNVTGPARSHPAADVMGAVLSVLWGVTLTGYLLFLWPLAYFTHFVLEWLEGT